VSFVAPAARPRPRRSLWQRQVNDAEPVGALWTPTAGSIEIDSQNITSVTKSCAADRVRQPGHVPVPGTIKEIWSQARPIARWKTSSPPPICANHEFISGLPWGRHPSGSWNRVYRRPATAAFNCTRLLKDAQFCYSMNQRPRSTEKRNWLRQSLDKLSVGRTTIVIAHRLATIIGADQILVLEKDASSSKALTGICSV